jgi:adenylate cyclase
VFEEADLEAGGLLQGLDDPVQRRERIALARELLEGGFTMEDLQEAAGRGRLGLLLVDRVLAQDARYTSVDIARESGLGLDLLTRLWRALGFAATADDDVAYTEADLAAARLVRQFRDAGLDDDGLVLVGHVLGHDMARLSDTVREVVGQALLEPGDSERTAGARWAQATEHLVPMLTPLLEYVLGVHLKEQIKHDIIGSEELATGRVDRASHVTVCFADLVGFTRLGERVSPGDLGMAERLLTELVLDAAPPPVRLVKTIGDAAMLVSTEPLPLMQAALRLVELACAPESGIPALRVGVAQGHAVSQRGDWFGAPVNLASRVTDFARPGSVLATREVRDSVRESFAWSFAGARRFRGVSEEVALYRARPPVP